MSVVKRKKQYEMVVVPHRPVKRAVLISICVLGLAALVAGSYEAGRWYGSELQESIIVDNIRIKEELTKRDDEIVALKRQLADLELGGEIDLQADQQVRTEIETLKNEIVQLNEEIEFYKGVMMPKASEKGLRIERLEFKETLEPNKMKYSLLLTQVVDRHNYIRGEVEIKLIGNQGEELREMELSEVSEKKENTISFRLKYFQELTGEIIIPEGFLPQQVLVKARSTGRNGQSLERNFDWTVKS